MVDDFIKHKVLYLLVNGWNDLEAIQHNLQISDKNWKEIMKWLQDENYIVIHTIH